MSDERTDDFYVGYMPMPSSHRGLVTWFVPALFVASLALGMAFALVQKRPLNGTGWDPEGLNAVVLEGVMYSEPYNILRFRSPQDQSVKTAVVTTMTKGTPTDRLAKYYGEALQVKGVMIQQEGRYVFSLLDDEEALKPADFSVEPFAMEKQPTAANVELKGEIIDPKCYLGAMKPGGGKTHKACAVLCLRGGIPPMFVTRDKNLQETYHLLVDGQGRPLKEEIISFVGDPIVATGSREQWGDLFVFKIDVQSIERL